jgi:7-keto-8-aminopelargonate synthetase-like enzyme
LREKILTNSGMFGGSTPLPLPLANAALASVEILRADKTLRRRLVQNVSYVKTSLAKSGLEISATPSPIIAVIPQSAREANVLKSRCIANGVFPSFIKYHGGPENGYFRFAISSEHTKKQLDDLVNALVRKD